MKVHGAVVPAGDRAALVRLGNRLDPELNARVHALARHLANLRHPAILEVIPAYTTVLVEYDPLRLPWRKLVPLLRAAMREARPDAGAGRVVEIPVVYGGEAGPDLADVARHAGITEEEAVRRHAGREYRVYCIGFSPGFCYLGDLDPALVTPRLATPRVSVPAGSVAIGGAQTGIYSRTTPGGWRILGRTPAVLFDPRRDPPSLLSPGDTVRFVPVSPEAAAAGAAGDTREGGLAATGETGAPANLTEVPGRTGVRIVRPGLLTTVQDMGRRGYQALGVPQAGAADRWALRLGNWLVGNPEDAAALEITLEGPEVEFTGPVTFALAGAPFPAELIPEGGGSPRPVRTWEAVLAGPGDRLRIGVAPVGARVYLCVAGGIDLPPVLGSCSEDLFGGIGPVGRALREGDWLPVGVPLLPPADLAGRRLPPDMQPRYQGSLRVRVIAGPQAGAFTAEGLETFLGAEYRVSGRSDRQGLRLEGPAIRHRRSADILSEGIPFGAIQVPADGRPILLLTGRHTIGGYTKIAVALSGDALRAAQLRPGDRVRFQQVDLAEAHRILRAEARRLIEIRHFLFRAGARGAPPLPAAAPPETPWEARAVAQGGAVPAATLPAAGAEPAPPPGPAAGVRHYRIRVAGREFLVQVEEVPPGR
ncbi:5-oxoprolinase subunit PxpB [Caldinitratiruptor microaerophilus]|uniref:Urea carboxylase n=1 Tax=Caldinitratiruptor microaerophilus TaxID=671077 RepID=A0AA35CRC0_9FIRM|nr:5-oxoprolinase subunit PxpB [Caldinitratiruptor microaerophilus]BDG62380.1 urea carboxylase [Caldinitratiruptor microaerophilus]